MPALPPDKRFKRQILSGYILAGACLIVSFVPAQASVSKSVRHKNVAERNAAPNHVVSRASVEKNNPVANRSSANLSTEQSSIYGTLLLALSTMEGLLFALLGVVVQVGPARSLRMVSVVFPVVRYVYFPMIGLSLQAFFLLRFNTAFIPKPVCAYAIFVINIMLIGVIASQAIRSFDLNYVVDGAVDWYFNE